MQAPSALWILICPHAWGTEELPTFQLLLCSSPSPHRTLRQQCPLLWLWAAKCGKGSVGQFLCAWCKLGCSVTALPEVTLGCPGDPLMVCSLCPGVFAVWWPRCSQENKDAQSLGSGLGTQSPCPLVRVERKQTPCCVGAGRMCRQSCWCQVFSGHPAHRSCLHCCDCQPFTDTHHVGPQGTKLKASQGQGIADPECRVQNSATCSHPSEYQG